MAYVQKRPFFGFAVLNDYFPAELMAHDPCRRELEAAGLDSETAAAVPLPTGELVIYGFTKLRWEAQHTEADTIRLNTLLPHLARAGLMAARLGLERAKATTATLQTIGLPAAVLTSNGRMLSSNMLFERLTNLFMPVAFGRLAIADIGANSLLQQAIESGLDATERVRSIPIGEKEGREACVVHIVPLRRSAYDLFPGGDMIIAVSALRKSSLVPSPQVLMGLFDLTPAETRFAIGLMSGASLRDTSQNLGITVSSGKTYLARIFEKTGTHRQAELFALLSSTHPIGQPGAQPLGRSHQTTTGCTTTLR
jgi:DNA-binding CsgD family transcriptional regulator